MSHNCRHSQSSNKYIAWILSLMSGLPKSNAILWIINMKMLLDNFLVKILTYQTCSVCTSPFRVVLTCKVELPYFLGKKSWIALRYGLYINFFSLKNTKITIFLYAYIVDGVLACINFKMASLCPLNIFFFLMD
jgi:hypothetical protein